MITAENYQRMTKQTNIAAPRLYAQAHMMVPTELFAVLNINYLVNGLTSEAGEVSGIIKKWMRDEGSRGSEAFREKMIIELGDCMWYISELCNELDVSMSEVMEANLAKLKDRAERGTLTGSGDDR